jgi:hypothetical protein
MGPTRLRAVLVALLVCVPSIALAAWPALGWQADDVRRTLGSDDVTRHHGPDAVWTDGVRITGNVAVPLSPGVAAPITVRFTNSYPRSVAMQRVRVSIASISAPHADATHRCTRMDFEIHQMPRRTLHVPARRAVDLTALGIPVASWPTLAMRNLPYNQDGCKGATVTLHFRTARLGRAAR